METAFEKAKALQEADRVNEAMASYREIPDGDPDAFKAYNNLGTLLEEQGRPEEAIDAYRQSIEVNPRSALVHYNLGRAFHRLGRLLDAQDSYRVALEIDPQLVAAHYNLANALYHQGRREASEAAYRRALELEPDLMQAHSNLGNVLFDQSRLPEAAQCYRRALELDPNAPAEHLNLGKVLDVLGQTDEAVAAYRQSLALNPESRTTQFSLARLLHRAGRGAEAAELFRQWLARKPDDPVILHMLAACTGRGVEPRAPDDYVRSVFDEFAADFELTLYKLQYRAPQLVGEALRQTYGQPRQSLDIVDAGCGTGLCGAFLRPYARRLAGVDLSQGMLAKAHEKGIYDELIAEELTAFLSRNATAYDAVVSGDTLVYFGDLAPVFEAVVHALRAGGAFLFTVEQRQAAQVGSGHHLNPNGRYSHTEQYIAEALPRAGLRVESIAHDVLRRESGQPVEGLVVRATTG
jgi:predicted TPR repeat methyltransferase